MKKKVIFIIAAITVILGYIAYVIFSNSSVEALSKYGSSGDEVRQIQQKLKNWGYYNGNVDGVFGSKTQEAVKKFQKANGLKQDRNCRRKNTCSNGDTVF